MQQKKKKKKRDRGDLARRTLIIGDEDGQNGQGDGPRAGVRDGFDDRVNLRRNVDIAELSRRPDGRRQGSVGAGLHGGCFFSRIFQSAFSLGRVPYAELDSIPQQ